MTQSVAFNCPRCGERLTATITVTSAETSRAFLDSTQCVTPRVAVDRVPHDCPDPTRDSGLARGGQIRAGAAVVGDTPPQVTR